MPMSVLLPIVQHDFVSYGDVVADGQRQSGVGVQHAAVLNVAAFANFDPVIVAAQHAIKLDA